MSSLFAFFYVVHVVLKSSDLTDQSVLAVILVSRQGWNHCWGYNSRAFLQIVLDKKLCVGWRDTFDLFIGTYFIKPNMDFT